MSTPSKNQGAGATVVRHRGIRIFTYPKIVFFIPTLLATLVCGIGMLWISDRTEDPTRARTTTTVTAPAGDVAPADAKAAPAVGTTTTTTPAIIRRFGTTQNFLATAFMVIFGLNLIIMSVDFPRFTVIALVTAIAAVGFFVLWLNVYYELLPPIVSLLEHVYLAANAGFYFAIATVLLLAFGVIWITRYLDYWEILPNEILHNHGPFSDLERFPTMNLKFDKEIPDILEYALLRSGRLVLHIPGHQRTIVLDNVLWINSKEEELKKLLSRMEVRVTTDREASETP